MSGLFRFGFTSPIGNSNKEKMVEPEPGKSSAAQKKQYELKRKRGFLPKWRNDFSWLRYNEEKGAMFCTACEKFGDKSSSFVTGCVTFRLESIKVHDESVLHLDAVKRESISVMREKQKVVMCSYTGNIEAPTNAENVLTTTPGCSNVIGALDLSIRKLNETQLQKLSFCFTSAYWIAKNELPFTLYPSVLELQQINGVELAKSYRNDQACRRFMEFIHKDIQMQADTLLRQARVLSIMFDGATDVSICENELVYARVVIDGLPRCTYVKMVNVEHAHAQGVLGAIEKAMGHIDDWKAKLIATGCDGAAVNLGKHNSVTALLKRDIPHLSPMHCVNHRLELGALDALHKKEAAVFADIKSILLELHKHYHYSAKALRELRSLAEAMEVKMLRPANLEGTRWMPHLSRALAILLKPDAYHVFVTHFEDIIESRKGTASVQGRAKNILKHLKCQKLLHIMHFMQDVLEVLSDLSLQFQRDTCSVDDTLDSLEGACLRLVALQLHPGKHLQDFIDNTNEELIFHGVKLSASAQTDEQLCAKRKTLVDNVIDHISGRMKDLETSPVLKAMQVFFMSNVPESEQELAVYGEEQVALLCEHFADILQRMGCQTDQIDNEWSCLKAHMFRNKSRSTDVLYKKLFTDPNLKDRYQNVLMLVEIVLVIPTSSAICERGFSTMARIKSDWRASLQPDMLNCLMAISVAGPPVGEYNCTRALDMWYSGGQRMRRPDFSQDTASQDDDVLLI